MDLLSSALYEAFSHLVDKHLTWEPLMSESVDSVIKALHTIKIHMQDKDLQSVLDDLIKELTHFIKNNDQRISIMENELKKQKHLFTDLVTKMEENELLFLANDLGDIYIHYIFEPKYSRIRGKPQTWTMFTNEVGRIEEKIRYEQLQRQIQEKPTMNDSEVEAQLAKPYDLIQKKFQVNIRDLRSLKKDRATIAHTRKRTDQEQQAFIEKARCVNMPPGFQYKNVFYTMIDELDAFNGQFHRMS